MQPGTPAQLRLFRGNYFLTYMPTGENTHHFHDYIRRCRKGAIPNTSTEVGIIVRRQTAVSEREKIRMRKTEGSEGGRKQTPRNAWGVSSNSGLLAILAVSQNGGGQTRLVQVLHVEQ